MGITQDSQGQKGNINPSLNEKLAKLHKAHIDFFLWETELNITNYSFSDFLIQIKLCTYNDNERITESKLMPCIRNVITDNDKIALIMPIFTFESLYKNSPSMSVDDALSIFFLLSKSTPLTLQRGLDEPIFDKAYYFLTKCSQEGEEAILLTAFAAFILNHLLPMLHAIILSYIKTKRDKLDSNEEKLELLQQTLNKNKTQFFSYLLSNGASDIMTLQELNKRFVDDHSFLSADYFISAYLNQSFA